MSAGEAPVAGAETGLRRGRVVAGLLALVLVAATCSEGDEAAPAADGDAAGAGAALDPDDLDGLEVGFVTDVAVTPTIAPPGHQIRVAVEGRVPDATVVVSHGDAEVEAPLDGSGQAVVTLPEDAAVGLHRVRVEREGTLLGIAALRVADGPGVWLQADRRFAAPDDLVTLTVTAAGMPLDAPAIVFAPPEVADWDDDWDDEEDRWDDDLDAGDGASMFRVHDSGALLPIGPTQLDPDALPTLADLVDRPITAPGHLAGLGGFRVAVLRDLDALADPGPGDVVWSSAAHLSPCTASGEVSGEVAGPSIVSALSLDGEWRTTAVETSGPYHLDAGPGPVLVIVRPRDLEQAPQAELVDVGCGGAAQLVTTAVEAPRVQRVAWSDATIPPRDHLRLASAGGDGREPCRLGFVTWNEPPPSYEAAYASTAGTLLDNALTRMSVLDHFVAGELLGLERQRQLLGAEDDLFDASELAGYMGADVIFPLRYVRGQTGDHFLLIAAVDNRERVIGRFQARETTHDGILDALEGPAFTGFVREVSRNYICVDAEPSRVDLDPGDTEDIEVTVTDLEGNGADGAEVEPSPQPECGELEPQGGQWIVSGETLELVFEAADRVERECVERLAFEATWDGGGPEEATGRSRPGEIRVGGRYRVEMDFAIDPASVLAQGAPMPMGGSMRLEAYNCHGGGILGEWEGVTEVVGDLGLVQGSDSFLVAFRLPSGGGPFTPTGIERLQVEGMYYAAPAGGDAIAITSEGHVLMVGDIEVLEEDAPCGS